MLPSLSCSHYFWTTLPSFSSYFISFHLLFHNSSPSCTHIFPTPYSSPNNLFVSQIIIYFAQAVHVLIVAGIVAVSVSATLKTEQLRSCNNPKNKSLEFVSCCTNIATYIKASLYFTFISQDLPNKSMKRHPTLTNRALNL